MSYVSDVLQYQSLMQHFIDGKLQTAEFITEYIRKWKKDRDEELSKKSKWVEPFDEILIKDLNNGLLSKEDFSSRWDVLWGFTAKSKAIQVVLDGVFSACEVHCGDPEREAYELDEGGLRNEVTSLMFELKGLLEIG